MTALKDFEMEFQASITKRLRMSDLGINRRIGIIAAFVLILRTERITENIR